MNEIILSRVSSDEKLIQIWLHNRPSGTQQGYCRDVEAMFEFIGKPLLQIALEDLQSYSTHLVERGLKESTQRRKLNSIKSLFSFGVKLNYIRFNVAAALRIPKGNSILAGRIIREREVFKLIDCHQLQPRDRALLKLIYSTGVRISEALNLVWNDFSETADGGAQAKITGKGHKMRVVLVPLRVWLELEAIRQGADGTTPVFMSCRGRRLERTAAHKIIKKALEEAGLDPKISMHWLRHAHAQHALTKGAPLHLVRDSLGHSNISVTNIYLESNPSDGSSKYLDF
ncbi:tyrosine-type recombinase/integrase [Trichocoleus sp. Lan]|uniref:tyrosine-type recombinase/integrase n=1 Tax=Trichocoleus sp. Lan TaxID=2933927 RepID=UPI0032975C1D